MSAVSGREPVTPSGDISSLPGGLKYNAEDHSFSLPEGGKVLVKDFRLEGRVVGKEDFTPEIQKAAAEILSHVLGEGRAFTEAHVKVTPDKASAEYRLGNREAHHVTYEKPIFEKMRAAFASLPNVAASPKITSSSRFQVLKDFASRIFQGSSALFRRGEGSPKPVSVNIPKPTIPKQSDIEAQKEKLKADLSAHANKLRKTSNIEELPSNENALRGIEKERKQLNAESAKLANLSSKLAEEEKALQEALPHLSSEEGLKKVESFVEKWKNLHILDAQLGNKWAELNMREAIARNLTPKDSALDRIDTGYVDKVNAAAVQKREALMGKLVRLPTTSEPPKVAEVVQRSWSLVMAHSPKEGVAIRPADVKESGKEEPKVIAEREVRGKREEEDEGVEMQEMAPSPLHMEARLNEVLKNEEGAEQVEGMRKLIKYGLVGKKGKGGHPKLFAKLLGRMADLKSQLDQLPSGDAFNAKKEEYEQYKQLFQEGLVAYLNKNRETEAAALLAYAFKSPMPTDPKEAFGHMLLMSAFREAVNDPNFKGNKEKVEKDLAEIQNDKYRGNLKAKANEAKQKLIDLGKQEKQLDSKFESDMKGISSLDQGMKLLQDYETAKKAFMKEQGVLRNQQLAWSARLTAMNPAVLAAYALDPSKGAAFDALDRNLQERRAGLIERFAKAI